MKRTAILLVMPLLSTLTGCASIGRIETPGEKASAYGYVPLDPLPVDQASGADSCTETSGGGNVTANADVLSRLPDQTIRFAVATFDQTKGSLTFGPATLTSKGGQYKAVLDYIQADAVPEIFYIRKRVTVPGQTLSVPVALSDPLPMGGKIIGYDAVISNSTGMQAALQSVAPAEVALARSRFLEAEAEKFAEGHYQQVTVPVYVGIGLRLSADILSLQGGLTLAGLSAIGAEAEAKRVTGTLTVQSLGVSGKSIATALPLPNKLDQTTIENAILAIGNMRATLYATGQGTNDLYKQPRIVGLYSPVGSDPLLINALYSELSRIRPRWLVPCGAAGQGKS
ncbi:hypothetical protein [Sphingobium indicum]|uniref:hypothetical protein n=1 Tax=Sphingobium indicum TaxID=332055 RepID=UPI0012DECB03|nr:hypothetical protein [Sphingobium indicum]